MSTWWYVSGSERMGPVSDDDLHRLLISGTITSSSLVWKTGMAGWQPAAEVEGLAPMLASLPPELPPELPPDQELQNEQRHSVGTEPNSCCPA